MAEQTPPPAPEGEAAEKRPEAKKPAQPVKPEKPAAPTALKMPEVPPPMRLPRAPEEAQDTHWWEDARDAVRKPLMKLFLAGAIAASPLVAGTVWAGDKILKNTIGKIPVAGQIYNKPRELVLKTAEITHETVVGALTSPALVAQTLKDVKDGMVGKKTLEAKGVVGRFFEKTTETVSGIGGGILRGGKWMLDKGISFIGGTLNVGKEIGKKVYDIVKVHPIATFAVGTLALGALANAAWSPIGAAQNFANMVYQFFQVIMTKLGSIPTPPVIPIHP